MPRQLFASQARCLSICLRCLFILCFVFAQFSFSSFLNFNAYLTVSTFKRDRETRNSVQPRKREGEGAHNKLVFFPLLHTLFLSLLLLGLETDSLTRLRLGNSGKGREERERAGKSKTLITIEIAAKTQQIFIMFL